MAEPRSLTPFVAAVAATALTVGGVLFGTAPVSAAPAQSAECTSALAALEEEFGDPDDFEDFDDAGADALLDEYEALFDAYEAALDELDALDARALEIPVEAAALGDDLETAQVALTAADTALTEAIAALETAQTEGTDDDVAVAQQAVEAAEDAQLLAAGRVSDIEDELSALDAELAALPGLIEQAEDAVAVLDAELTEFELLLEELFGDFDIDRLLDLLVTVALECTDEGDDTGDAGVGSAPVATPVTARATFTG